MACGSLPAEPQSRRVGDLSLGDDKQPCADDMLMFHRCVRCAKLLAPITSACSSCGSGELERVPSSGVGSVVSWRVVDRAPIDRQGGLVPLTIAIVALDEGPWVYTCLEGEIPPSPNGRCASGSSPIPGRTGSRSSPSVPIRGRGISAHDYLCPLATDRCTVSSRWARYIAWAAARTSAATAVTPGEVSCSRRASMRSTVSGCLSGR